MKGRGLMAAVVILLGAAAGCAPAMRTAPTYSKTFHRVKTVAILPPDLKVYKLTAGGVRELIDSWSEEAKTNFVEAAVREIPAYAEWRVRRVGAEDLAGHESLWKDQKALFAAVMSCAVSHALGPDAFPAKKKTFDYTMGPAVGEISRALGADALLFTIGYDHDATVGRKALLFWNLVVGAATGVVAVPRNPSFLVTALVDGRTGDVEWFKVSPPDGEYTFRNEANMESLVRWMVRDLRPRE